MSYAVAWIANGFSPESPFTTDEFSHAALRAAVKEYKQLTYGDGREHVPFLVINSIVRDPKGMVALRDTMLADVRKANVPEEDIVLLPTETTGSPTDALALASYARGQLDLRFAIFTTTPAVNAYFEVMYMAVARHVVGCEPIYDFYWTTKNGSLARRFVYWAMRMVTRIAAKKRWAFCAWYNFLNRSYRKRAEGFTRTVT